MLDYIRESAASSGVYYLNDEIPVWMEESLPDGFNLGQALKNVEEVIPSAFFRYVQAVKIGMFDEMIERELNALYKDGVLYITNMQDNEMDFVDDVVHEIAHAVEQHNVEMIYHDGSILQEFLGKRKRLFHLLKSEGFNVIIDEFMNPEYDVDFDLFLLEEIGYLTLQNIAGDLFVSPYSVTSLSEYYAVGFESFYLNDYEYLKRMCPRLFEKIHILSEIADEY